MKQIIEDIHSLLRYAVFKTNSMFASLLDAGYARLWAETSGIWEPIC